MPQYYVDLHNLKQAQTQLTKEEEDLRKKYDNVFLIFLFKILVFITLNNFNFKETSRTSKNIRYK